MLPHALLLVWSVAFSVGLDYGYEYLDPVKLQTKVSPIIQQATAALVIRRYTPRVTVRIDPELFIDHRDTFKLSASDGNLYIDASTGVAAVWGFNYYLKKYCKSHIGWQVQRVVIPPLLPDAQEMVVANDRFRYYMNVCTASYSFVWWSAEEWLEHVEWMALNGINIALAPVAQEAVWTKIYLDYGLTQEEIDNHFTGPAFLSWSRMGNVHGWGGPLPQSWHKKQKTIQKKIVDYMYQLGMVPVFPAFNGHVPRALARLVKNTTYLEVDTWNNFSPQYCCGLFLNPLDPLFKFFGKLFLKEISKEMIMSQVYTADPFNEITVYPWSTTLVSQTAEAIYSVLSDFDQDAVWLIQNWMFVHNPLLWPVRRVKAFLTSVPIGRMLVLDLQSEQWPQFELYEMYYGQPFIWCMLHNFGGTLGMFGNMKAVSKNVFRARSHDNSSMIGIGLTPEGINQNYVMYELMLENAWRKEPIKKLDEWAADYAMRRYGCNDTAAAWRHLVHSIYSFNGLNKMRGKYVVTHRPSYNLKPWAWYPMRFLFRAFKEFVFMNNTDCYSPGFKHDLVDITREALQYRAAQIYLRLRGERFLDSWIFNKTKYLFLDAMNDLETILSTNDDFKATTWLTNSKKIAANDEEEYIYEFNARNQITLWGPNGEISDYAGKQWAELFRYYYTPRWAAFLEATLSAMLKRERFNEERVQHLISMTVENKFHSVPIGSYPDTDPRPVARALYEKWANLPGVVELPLSILRNMSAIP